LAIETNTVLPELGSLGCNLTVAYRSGRFGRVTVTLISARLLSPRPLDQPRPCEKNLAVFQSSRFAAAPAE